MWDMRHAQRYVFGNHKRLRIYRYCQIKFGPSNGTAIPQFCRCEDTVANSRLCWDCRRTLIWRTWSRNIRNRNGPSLPNGIPINGKKFPHCDETEDCSWCLHSPNHKKYGECHQPFCVHCPVEENSGWEDDEEHEEPEEVEEGEGQGGEENGVTPPTGPKLGPDFEDDQLFFDELHDEYNRYETYEEALNPDCPVCGIDIDGLRLLEEDSLECPKFEGKYTFLCLACGSICSSNTLKDDSLSRISPKSSPTRSDSEERYIET
jgi:hypothetical protein